MHIIKIFPKNVVKNTRRRKDFSASSYSMSFAYQRGIISFFKNYIYIISYFVKKLKNLLQDIINFCRTILYTSYRSYRFGKNIISTNSSYTLDTRDFPCQYPDVSIFHIISYTTHYFFVPISYQCQYNLYMQNDKYVPHE